MVVGGGADVGGNAATNEETPLLSIKSDRESASLSVRETIYEVLEGRGGRAGRIYQSAVAALIVASILSFVLGSLFDPVYMPESSGPCAGVGLCDALLFGNNPDNGLGFLGRGSFATSVLEIVTVAVFTVDYVLRLITCDLESTRYAGTIGRLRYLPTFYSLVDLASTLPFYYDALDPSIALEATQFLRMFRFFRMLRVDSRYTVALTLFDDVFRMQSAVLGTAVFLGSTTWVVVASLYYLAERDNTAMIYCPDVVSGCNDGIDSMDDVDTSLCTIDSWGIVDCSAAGCPSSSDGETLRPCRNEFESIGSASYLALLNLFGEFPKIQEHSVWGKVVGTLTAVVAVAFFALPTGIVGNGIEELVNRRRDEQAAADAAASGVCGEDKDVEEDTDCDQQRPSDAGSLRGRLYCFLELNEGAGAKIFEWTVNVLIIGSCLAFAVDTVLHDRQGYADGSAYRESIDTFELACCSFFAVEYLLRLISAGQDPRYCGPGGTIRYLLSFDSLVDLSAFLPYLIRIGLAGNGAFSLPDPNGTWSSFVRAFRLVRILHFERYIKAFAYFDDIARRNADLLAMTGFTALLVWLFFSAALYVTERNNPDAEMRGFYRSVPHSMWVSLLNLSGESPLSNYSVSGKVLTGIMGLFATALFGIPIGILGAGFEEVVDDTCCDEESADEDENCCGGEAGISGAATSVTVQVHGFVTNAWFETLVFAIIGITVLIGILQTFQGQEDTLSSVEVGAVVFFTLEWFLRLVASPADPSFRSVKGWWIRCFHYVVSFYSIVDILAILPYYLALALPGGWVDGHDEYFRMLRLLRLLKLDKYIPSFSLIDDVCRRKRQALATTCFAAGALWVIFSGVLYVAEYKDDVNGIDDVPIYGCDEDCTMKDRFRTYFDSAIYTGVHLTGDYPIVTYNGWARVVNFFMVIAAVGVVSIPSGILAAGFCDVCSSKAKARRGEPQRGNAGDGWYELRLAELKDQEPPKSRFGAIVDNWQIKVNNLLNSSAGWRVFMMSLIFANVVALILETVPEIDRFVGNESGNFFDVFEAISIFFFTVEFAMRVFCAEKNVEALYSPFVYVTTFYGIVDILSIAPWYIKEIMFLCGVPGSNEVATTFRVVRVFRLLQLEDFFVGFRMIDNVWRASKDVLTATGLMAVIVWVGSAALFYIFESENPNWRECDPSIPLRSTSKNPGCYDFATTAECSNFYGDGMCEQTAFANMADSLYYVAVFGGGEWGVVDFTWGGRIVCVFLCVVGIAIYAIPVGSLFDSFGAVIGLVEDEEEEADGDGDGGG